MSVAVSVEVSVFSVDYSFFIFLYFVCVSGYLCFARGGICT